MPDPILPDSQLLLFNPDGDQAEEHLMAAFNLLTASLAGQEVRGLAMPPQMLLGMAHVHATMALARTQMPTRAPARPAWRRSAGSVALWLAATAGVAVLALVAMTLAYVWVLEHHG